MGLIGAYVYSMTGPDEIDGISVFLELDGNGKGRTRVVHNAQISEVADNFSFSVSEYGTLNIITNDDSDEASNFVGDEYIFYPGDGEKLNYTVLASSVNEEENEDGSFSSSVLENKYWTGTLTKQEAGKVATAADLAGKTFIAVRGFDDPRPSIYMFKDSGYVIVTPDQGDSNESGQVVRSDEYGTWSFTESVILSSNEGANKEYDGATVYSDLSVRLSGSDSSEDVVLRPATVSNIDTIVGMYTGSAEGVALTEGGAESYLRITAGGTMESVQRVDDVITVLNSIAFSISSTGTLRFDVEGLNDNEIGFEYVIYDREEGSYNFIMLTYGGENFDPVYSKGTLVKVSD